MQIKNAKKAEFVVEEDDDMGMMFAFHMKYMRPLKFSVTETNSCNAASLPLTVEWVGSS